MTGQELAKTMSGFVNSFSPDSKGFIETVMREHKTLQQSVIRLCFDLIRAMAKQDYVDGRNAASVAACQDIVNTCGDRMNLPFI